MVTQYHTINQNMSTYFQWGLFNGDYFMLWAESKKKNKQTDKQQQNKKQTNKQNPYHYSCEWMDLYVLVEDI